MSILAWLGTAETNDAELDDLSFYLRHRRALVSGPPPFLLSGGGPEAGMDTRRGEGAGSDSSPGPGAGEPDHTAGEPRPLPLDSFRWIRRLPKL